MADALSAGVLDENTGRVELKREIGRPSKGTNSELARDLASLAIEGGVFIVGVQEARDGEPALLTPVPLHGLPERIEQVALTRCDPPLSIRCVEIPTSDDPTVGYLSVIVPASADAPHMVDGRYWGRGAATKRMLSDRDVEQLHDRRRRLASTAEDDLEAFVARDPIVQAGLDDRGHMFVVAVPLGARADLLVDVLGGPQWQRPLLELVRSALRPWKVNYAPDLSSATQPGTSAGGWAVSTYPAGHPVEYPSGALALELGEDGTVRLFCGRATDRYGRDEEEQLLFEELVTGLTLRTVSAAATVADRTGFGGRWALGLALTGIGGTGSWLTAKHLLGSDRRYPEDEYRKFTTADSVELAVAPHRVADRLVGSMLRTMDARHAAALAALLDQDPAGA